MSVYSRATWIARTNHGSGASGLETGGDLGPNARLSARASAVCALTRSFRQLRHRHVSSEMSRVIGRGGSAAHQQGALPALHSNAVLQLGQRVIIGMVSTDRSY